MRLICEDCGRVFEGGPKAYFCMECRKRKLSASAKRRNLNKIGNAAYSKKQAAASSKEAARC